MAHFLKEPARKTPVEAEADVIVVGGGTSGVVAALAAAKTGAKTILVEKQGQLGGTLFGGGLVIQGFFNQYRLYPEAEKVQLIRGVPEQILNRMKQAGGTWGFVDAEIGEQHEPVRVVFNPEIWKQTILDMLEEAGVQLFLNTCLSSAIVVQGDLSGIVVENKAGRAAILGRVFIDTTGDGDLAVRSGAPYVKEIDQDRYYKTGLIFGLNRVDQRRVFEFGRDRGIIRNLARVHPDTPEEVFVVLNIDLRSLPETADVMNTNGMWGPFMGTTRQGEYHYINSTATQPDEVLNTKQALSTEKILRNQVLILADLLKKHVPGFEHSYIHYTAPQLGIRRSRTILCEYDLTNEDIVECRSFPDEVGRFGWHDMSQYQPKNGGSYGVPYRALLPKKVENLLVSGRCITSQYEAQNSTRIIGCCWVQAEGAGTAAALSAMQRVAPRNLDTSMLRERLMENGVYLPQNNL